MTVDLDRLKRQWSSTDREERNRCPNCERVKIREVNREAQTKRDVERGQWVCKLCGNEFDTPLTGVSDP